MTANEYLSNLLAQQILTTPELNGLRALREQIQGQLSVLGTPPKPSLTDLARAMGQRPAFGGPPKPSLTDLARFMGNPPKSSLADLVRTIGQRPVLDGEPRFYYGGSYGKHTIIRQRYDLDIIIYWPNSTTSTIKGIYSAVGEELQKNWKTVRPKTVSWELSFPGGFHIDVVPGRALDDSFREANLYRTDTGTTLKTSLKTHIDTVRNSGRRDAIRLMKLWREKKRVPFKKTFLLELMTIYGCHGTPTDNLDSQVQAALLYIRENILDCNIKDPANSNNSLTEDLSVTARILICNAAKAAVDARNWLEVFT